MSFDFDEQTPDDVLAAFAALAPSDAREGAPVLPRPVVEAWDPWTPDWRDAGYPDGEGDPFERWPWVHDWASWLSTSMSVQTTPHGRLTWSELGTWNLDCRFSWKTDPDMASEALSWLAPYVDGANSDRKVLVGHARFEYAPRPHLFWVDQGRWELEDLNPDDDWMWG